MIGIWIIFGIATLISWIIGSQLKSRFKIYAKLPTNYGMSGKDVAEKMLLQHGIQDVQVLSVDGELTDHYNPLKKTVNLSREVYNGTHISAAAVAAHECGHAIQHAKAYAPLKFRSAMVPILSITNKWVQWILLLGIVLVQAFPQILFIGIVMFGFTTIFSIITLPVEIDASRRALAWLNTSGITHTYHDKAKDALKWAAYTYVIAALASLATLLYYVFIFLSATRDE